MSARLRGNGAGGFALIVTLALLAMLVLAVFSLGVLVRTSSQVSAAALSQANARQHALLGMTVALAELQQAAGPDNVVTAPSLVRAKTTPYYSCLLGVWPNAGPTANPTNWFVSGNFAPDSPRSVNYSTTLVESPSVIALVGAGSATSGNYALARRISVPSPQTGVELGGYAFWIGDEGAKASLNVPASIAPRSAANLALVADPTGEIPTFQFGMSAVAKVLATEQIRNVAPGASLKSRFHSYTARSYWITGGTQMAAGLFNVNTTSTDAWVAILRAYDAAKPPTSVALGGRVGSLASSLTGNLGAATVSGGKVRYGPFLSVDKFWASDLMKDSLAEAKIADVSQDDLMATISPMLAARSDTFRIRAYGDALNPVDGAKEASAYCEAIVQRTPEVIDATLGRRFVVTYFRWLGPDDI